MSANASGNGQGGAFGGNQGGARGDGAAPAALQRAIMLHQGGRLAEAARLYRDALRQAPRHPLALHFLGLLHCQQGNFKDAVPLIEQAVAAKHDYVEAHYNLGKALQSLGRHRDAARSYERALALKPDYADARYNLGSALLALDQNDAAAAQFEKLLASDPAYPGAHNNLGSALKALDRHEPALRHFQAAVRLNAADADARYNLALMLLDMNRQEESIAEYDRVLAARPGDADAITNKGFALLALGRLKEGLPLFHGTTGRDPALRPRGRDVPLWRGEAEIRGKTLWVQDDQGFGDVIQSLRYVAALRSRGVEVLLQVKPPLADLARRSFPGVRIMTAEPPDADYRVPCMALPLALQTDSETDIPRDCPYLTADPDRAAAWRARLHARHPRAVAFAWRGNPDQANDRNRSMPLAALAPLFACPGVEFVCVQKGLSAAETATLGEFPNVVALDAELASFDDTAAVLSAVDLVATVDTSVAHLAGALARPLWVMLAFNADWRYFVGRRDWPWYPTATLIRQRTHGDWAGVVDEVRRCLLETPPGKMGEAP